MDDKFIESLKSLSQDMLEEQQRPPTAQGPSTTTARPSSSALFGGRTSGIVSMGGGRPQQDDSEVTTLASYRPESAAFTFTFRPRTGRMGGGGSSGDQERSYPARGPSARPGGRLASARPKSTFRRGLDDSDSYIPDLDEVREEDLTMTVASAPAYELQRMASLTELDAELSQTKALSVVDGVNLRKLCKYLVPEKELAENDEYWTWDRLYTEIISAPDLGHLVRFQRRDNDADFDSLVIQ